MKTQSPTMCSFIKDEQLQPRLEEAKTGKRTVYFVDAAHFVLGAFLGYIWSLTRIFVRTPSGRQRFNVLGALNAITKELVTITNDSYITSTQVCELKKKCLYSKYYSNFKELSHAISHFLATMNFSHQDELDSLLTFKFQLFTEEQIKKAGDYDKAAPTLSVIESTQKTPVANMKGNAVAVSTCVEAA